MYIIMAKSMSLQYMSLLTQPQPGQGSADVQHTLSLRQALKDKADASTSSLHPHTGITSLAVPWSSRNTFASGSRRKEPRKAGASQRVRLLLSPFYAVTQRHPQLSNKSLSDRSLVGKGDNCMLAFKRNNVRVGKVK